AQAGLDDKSVVQLWNSEEFAKMATGKGSKLIMSPAKRAYIDMQYDSSSRIGLHWAAYIEVDDAYNWDPATYVPGIGKADILGIEAALWTETVATTEDIDYLAFPRLPGYGEIGWTPAPQRNWEGYQKRLAAHGARFKALGVGYYPSKKVNW
ncbi:MAG: beta-N-acetylhexosaminidase, partial [Bacteroidetes bacterium]